MGEEEFSLVLQYINAVREHCGLNPLLEIPKGSAPDGTDELSRSCPLARAIPNTVIALEYARTSDRKTAKALSQTFGVPLQIFIEFPGESVADLPEVLMDFIVHYDNHQLPQFIEES